MSLNKPESDFLIVWMYFVGWCDAEAVSASASDYIPQGSE